MDQYLNKRQTKRQNRVWRVRKQVKRNSSVPRLSVHRSNQHLFAQIIDDDKGITLAGVGTMSKDLRQKGKALKKSKGAAKEIGAKIAELAKKQNIEKVVFDRGRYKFHGLIAELAGAAREGGLKF
ncbi:MAG: 50S ribosomal protein L18 [Chlamydiales bacterium]